MGKHNQAAGASGFAPAFGCLGRSLQSLQRTAGNLADRRRREER